MDDERSDDERRWDTSPLYEPQAGPDQLGDAVLGAANGLVAAWRWLVGKVRRRPSDG